MAYVHVRFCIVQWEGVSVDLVTMFCEGFSSFILEWVEIMSVIIVGGLFQISGVAVSVLSICKFPKGVFQI